MPMSAAIVGVGALWLVAAVSVVTSLLAASGKLERNHVAGIRLPSTMASDAAWRAGHRAAIPITWLTVPVAVVGSAVVALTNPGSVLVFAALLIAILIAATVVAGNAARRVRED